MLAWNVAAFWHFELLFDSKVRNILSVFLTNFLNYYCYDFFWSHVDHHTFELHAKNIDKKSDYPNVCIKNSFKTFEISQKWCSWKSTRRAFSRILSTLFFALLSNNRTISDYFRLFHCICDRFWRFQSAFAKGFSQLSRNSFRENWVYVQTLIMKRYVNGSNLWSMRPQVRRKIAVQYFNNFAATTIFYRRKLHEHGLLELIFREIDYMHGYLYADTLSKHFIFYTF